MYKNLTKEKIIEKIHLSVGLSRNECSFFLDEMIKQVLESLKNGHKVKIANCGSFSIRGKSSRIGRNPKTKEEAIMSARNVLKFKASNSLLNKINKS